MCCDIKYRSGRLILLNTSHCQVLLITGKTKLPRSESSTAKRLCIAKQMSPEEVPLRSCHIDTVKSHVALVPQLFVFELI